MTPESVLTKYAAGSQPWAIAVGPDGALKWKLPKSPKVGTDRLRLLDQGAAKATTKVKVTK